MCCARYTAMVLHHLIRFVSALDQRNDITEVSSAGQIAVFGSISGAVQVPYVKLYGRTGHQLDTPLTCCMLHTSHMQALCNQCFKGRCSDMPCDMYMTACCRQRQHA